MNEKFLNILIKECKKAFKKDEVPIACIITKNNKITYYNIITYYNLCKIRIIVK